MSRTREKLSQLSALSDGLCSPSSRDRTPPANFARCLTAAVEVFFALLDDADADVRIQADECVNRVTRTLAETHAGRLQVELYKEIKKNGAARCLRVALIKFGELSSLIRPQKGRAYVTNLLPCLVRVARRQEESVHEAMAIALPRMFAVLGKIISPVLPRDEKKNSLVCVCVCVCSLSKYSFL